MGWDYLKADEPEMLIFTRKRSGMVYRNHGTQRVGDGGSGKAIVYCVSMGEIYKNLLKRTAAENSNFTQKSPVVVQNHSLQGEG
jgi:hypothetical protein